MTDWILVTERLPEKAGVYLVYAPSADSYWVNEITHWMPLPEPPDTTPAHTANDTEPVSNEPCCETTMCGVRCTRPAKYRVSGPYVTPHLACVECARRWRTWNIDGQPTVVEPLSEKGPRVGEKVFVILSTEGKACMGEIIGTSSTGGHFKKCDVGLSPDKRTVYNVLYFEKPHEHDGRPVNFCWPANVPDDTEKPPC